MPTTEEKVDQSVIDGLTVNNPAPAPNPPGFQPLVVKVDGKDVKVETQAQLVELVQKGLDYTRKTQDLAAQRKEAETALRAMAAAKKYHDEEDQEALREFYTLLGRPASEIEELMSMFAPDTQTPPPDAPPTPGNPTVPNDKISQLEAQVARLTELLSDREGVTLDRLLTDVLTSDEQVKKALVGLDETTATNRREWMFEQAKDALVRIIDEGKRKGKPYSPSEERILARKAVENASELIKRLGLDKSAPVAGPSPALVPGDSSTPLAEPRLPANADLSKMSSKDVGSWITGFAAKILHDARLADR